LKTNHLATLKYCNKLPNQDCQILVGKTHQNGKNATFHYKILQMVIRYTQIYHPFLFQYPPKYTQIGIFGMQLNHLATLYQTVEYVNTKFICTTDDVAAGLYTEEPSIGSGYLGRCIVWHQK
jgi:hypothetical protein